MIRMLHDTPSFPSPTEERVHRKLMLSVAYRFFSLCGFDDGINGHITVRDPIRPDCFWVAPLGRAFSAVHPRDLVLVDAAGHVVEGEYEINAAAFAIHAAIHRARPDVNSAAHAHTTWGRTWATTGRLLDPLTQDACTFYEDHSIYAEYNGVVLDPAEGDRIAAALGAHKAVILANHGLLTVGGCVEEAAWWFAVMERCCEVQIRAETLGTPLRLPDAVARRTASEVGTPREGWHSFQPVCDRVLAQHPDLLES